jgi:hypothetical protein
MALTDAQREQLRVIAQTLHALSDDAHGRVRTFRNLVLAAIVILSIGLFAVAIGQDNPPWLPIRAGASTSGPTVWQVELVGALGGMLAGLAGLLKLPGFTGPYSLPATLALLNLPAGALTGLLGALWMQNSLVGSVKPQEGTALLAYVALFGFAQEAVTRFADKRGSRLLGEATGSAPNTNSP